MGKWPILDKMKMIDGRLDDDEYEHQIGRASCRDRV